MAQNKWLAFANEKRCRHADSLLEQKKISWVMGRRYHFNIGDVVFLFMSNDRCVRFKTVVKADNCEREDSDYWIGEAPHDITYRLEFVKEYKGSKLSEHDLKKYGFKDGSSLQHPMKGNKELLDYIDSEFN